MIVAVAFLMVIGSLLAMAEAAMSRMSRIRAMAQNRLTAVGRLVTR